MALAFRLTVPVAACLSAALTIGSSIAAQTPILPTVVAAALPAHPPIPRQAGVNGVVRLQVYTDGEKVSRSVVLETPPQLASMFASAIDENLQTWRFARHVPTSFQVTFRFTSLRSEPPDPCGPGRKDPWMRPEAVSALHFPTDFDIQSLTELIAICDRSETTFLQPVSRIRGTVLCDCADRHPIAGADVAVGHEGRVVHQTRTDAHGAFSVAAARWGLNEITVGKHGYFERFYKVKYLPFLWNPPGGFALEIRPDRAADLPEPRTQTSLVPTAVPFYPTRALAASVEGEVRVKLSADGDLIHVDGPTLLADPTLELVRSWKKLKGDDPSELRFHYTLLDGDCLGGGPTIIFTGSHDIAVTVKRSVPCGSR